MVHSYAVVLHWCWFGRKCTWLNLALWYCRCSYFHTKFLIPESIDVMVRVAIVKANYGFFTSWDDVLPVATLPMKIPAWPQNCLSDLIFELVSWPNHKHQMWWFTQELHAGTGCHLLHHCKESFAMQGYSNIYILQQLTAWSQVWRRCFVSESLYDGGEAQVGQNNPQQNGFLFDCWCQCYWNNETSGCSRGSFALFWRYIC
jgi:hypothetical protein